MGGKRNQIQNKGRSGSTTKSKVKDRGESVEGDRAHNSKVENGGHSGALFLVIFGALASAVTLVVFGAQYFGSDASAESTTTVSTLTPVSSNPVSTDPISPSSSEVDSTTTEVAVAPSTTSVINSELAVPSDLSESNQGIDASGRPFIALRWSTPSGVPTVEIERDGDVVREDDNNGWRDVPKPALLAGDIVTYRIRSKDSTGAVSPWSDPLIVTVATN